MCQINNSNLRVKAKSRRAHNFKKVRVGRGYAVADYRKKTLLFLSLTILLSLFFWCVGEADQAYAAISNTTAPVVLPVKPTRAQSSSPEVRGGWDEFVKAAHKVSDIYNFPVQVVLAQGALESSRGTSRFAVERNNFLGIGAFDSNPDAAFTFENPEQCVVEYMRLIRKNFPEAWENRENPEELLKKLKHNSKGNMYATDPNYVNKVMSMNEWR